MSREAILALKPRPGRQSDRRRLFFEQLEGRRVLATLDIVATDANKLEADSGSTPFTFTVSRTGDTSGPSTVDFSVAGSGADPASGTDFVGGTFPTGEVPFTAGQTSQTITINVSGDTTDEPDEGFTVTLSNPSSPDTIGTAAASGTIQDNDGTTGGTTLAIAATDANKAEGNTGSTSFTFTVTRSGDTTGTTTVNYAVSGGTAAAGDFTGGSFPNGQVSFAAGETTQIITVPVNGDTQVEPNEDFTVTLSNPSSPATITTATAPGNIQNDDGTTGGTTLAIAATDANKAEGNTGSTPFTFTVTRSGDTTGTTTVNYAVTGSGANPAAAGDFQSGVFPNGTVTFTAGQSTQTITVNVNGDTTVEPNEGFTVTLSNPSSPATITTASAAGTIVNDDTAAATTLAIAAANAVDLEGDTGSTPFTFTVTRSGDTTGATSVNYAVSGSGADPATASDFVGGVFPTGTVTFTPGQSTQTITVNVNGDTTEEFDEDFTVTLSGASGTATIITPSANGTILNDDEAPTRIEVVTENEPGDSNSAFVTDDLDNPGQGALVVTGTSRNDVIIVEPRPGRSSQIRVRRNGKTIGNFDKDEVQSIVVFGLGGHDVIIVNARLSIDALLFGDSGNDKLFGARGEDGLDGGSGIDRLFGLQNEDRLVGGPSRDFLYGGVGQDQLSGEDGDDFLFGESGHDILLGGDGNDRLFGGSGRDLLIGGEGSDDLFGGSDDDVLIGGSTAYDADEEALAAILAEMRSRRSFSTRTNNLRNGGGENGGFTLDDSTVEDDGRSDDLFGQGGSDLFVRGSGDRVKDKGRNDRVA